MNDMWINLLPVLFAMMISPARTLAVLLLLHPPRSTVTALSYVLGMISAMMAQGCRTRCCHESCRAHWI